MKLDVLITRISFCIILLFQFSSPVEARWRWKYTPRQKQIVKNIKNYLSEEGQAAKKRGGLGFGAWYVNATRDPFRERLGIGPWLSAEDFMKNISEQLGLKVFQVQESSLQRVGMGDFNTYSKIHESDLGFRVPHGARVLVGVFGVRMRSFTMGPLQREIDMYNAAKEFGGPELHGIALHLSEKRIGLVVEHLEKSGKVTKEAMEELGRRAMAAGKVPADLRPPNVVMTAQGIRPIDVTFWPLNKPLRDSPHFDALDPMVEQTINMNFSFSHELKKLR